MGVTRAEIGVDSVDTNRVFFSLIADRTYPESYACATLINFDQGSSLLNKCIADWGCEGWNLCGFGWIRSETPFHQFLAWGTINNYFAKERRE